WSGGEVRPMGLLRIGKGFLKDAPVLETDGGERFSPDTSGVYGHKTRLEPQAQGSPMPADDRDFLGGPFLMGEPGNQALRRFFGCSLKLVFWVSFEVAEADPREDLDRLSKTFELKVQGVGVENLSKGFSPGRRSQPFLH